MRKIRERHGVLLKGSGVPEVSAPLVPPIVRKVWCYPVQFALPPIRMPNVEYLNERENMTVKYSHPSMQQPDTHVISSLYLQKLVSFTKMLSENRCEHILFNFKEQLYRFSCDDKKFDLFIPRAYCMLKRYATFLGNQTQQQQESEMTQASIPTAVFECLNRHFSVTFECFASPLNCYFRNYCSAFGDTDSYYGSRG